ncbi:hypothetical protein [Maribacter sp. HTCC2170]|uniref:hypothetical protein n=1 Tax=Maribacter sp. (strain HTCC2170 / KCCM 42371) TaxID=313603 RepID=UPI0002E758BE|nr:hypothetical protein [Maribacter sp. HTCC2170]
MSKLKNTPFYHEAFNELNYSFGSFFLFETFIVAEINEDVVFNWEEHGKLASKDISSLYGNNGKDLIYLTNRINQYAVQPSDWLNFYKNSFKLKGYGIINYTKTGYFNNILEKIFTSSNFRSFTSLEDAIIWAKHTTNIRSSKAS